MFEKEAVLFNFESEAVVDITNWRQEQRDKLERNQSLKKDSCE